MPFSSACLHGSQNDICDDFHAPTSIFPVREYLRNNTALSSSELHHILQSTARLTAETTRLDEAALTDLPERREWLDRSLAEHKALVAPIRRCPPEILTEIFDEVTSRAFTPSSMEVPVLLGAVCHHWRQVSLLTPRMWSSIHVCLQTDSCTSLAATWLSRSGQCALQLGFYTDRKRHDHVEWESRLRIVLDVFASDLSRISLLNLRIPDEIYAPFDIFCGSLPVLTTVEVFIASAYPSDESVSTLAKLLPFFPRLQRFSIVAPYRFVPSVGLGLSWHQLTHIRLCKCNISSFRFILEHCPDLRRFVLYGALSVPPNLDDPLYDVTPVQNLSLQVLDVLQGEGFNIFPYCTLPSLASLTIVNRVAIKDSSLAQSILDFLARSQCRLDKLSLVPTTWSIPSGRPPFEWPPEDVPALLQHMPTLKELDLTDLTTGSPQDDDILMRMTRGQDTYLTAASKKSHIVSHMEDPPEMPVPTEGAALGREGSLPMLPNLQTLTLSHRMPQRVGSDSHWEDRLVDMLHSRWRCRATRLREGGSIASVDWVKVLIDYRPSATTLLRLKQLSDEGLSVIMLVNGEHLLL